MKDATLETISNVRIHPHADRLEIAQILGFDCVVQKGLYKGGETIVFIRPDAVLPDADWAKDYKKHSPQRLRALKLMEVWSEGIIVPFEILPVEKVEVLQKLTIGADVSELLEVKHFDNSRVNPFAKGVIPFNVPRTKEERVEDLEPAKIPYNQNVDISLKIDGESSSFYYDLNSKKFGILTRREELKTKWDADNLFQKILIWIAFKFQYFERFLKVKSLHEEIAETLKIKNKLITFCNTHNVSIVIRGELTNFNKKLKWSMFSTYLIKERRYATKGDSFYYIDVARALELDICPLVETNVILTPEKIKHYSTDIKKLNNIPFEGVGVYRLQNQEIPENLNIFLKKKLSFKHLFMSKNARFSNIAIDFFTKTLNVKYLEEKFGSAFYHNSFGEGVSNADKLYASYFININNVVFHIGFDNNGIVIEADENTLPVEMFDAIKKLIDDFIIRR